MNAPNQPKSLANIFGDVIRGYSRAQAIADGVLVAVPELDAALAGFVIPFAVNLSVWGTCRASEHAERGVMLAQCRKAVGGVPDGADSVYFDLMLPNGGELPVVIHIGPGDAAEPVLTLCLPSDL